MTDFTPILHLPEVAPNQDQKEATINTAIAILEAAMNDTLPVNVTAGDVDLTQDQFTRWFLFQVKSTTALSPTTRTAPRVRHARAGSRSRTRPTPRSSSPPASRARWMSSLRRARSR
jgi:hypothetical protein